MYCYKYKAGYTATRFITCKLVNRFLKTEIRHILIYIMYISLNKLLVIFLSTQYSAQIYSLKNASSQKDK